MSKNKTIVNQYSMTFKRAHRPKWWTERGCYSYWVDGKKQYAEGKMLCGTPYKELILVSGKARKYGIESAKTGVFTINNYKYNGFMGNTMPGIAPFTAKFVKWSGDPGVAIMDCSDGKQRYIPTFAILGDFIIPRKEEYNKGILFGHSSNS